MANVLVVALVIVLVVVIMIAVVTGGTAGSAVVSPFASMLLAPIHWDGNVKTLLDAMLVKGWRFKADPSIQWTIKQLELVTEMKNHPINMTNSPPTQIMYSVRMAIGHPELPIENRVQLQRETAQGLSPGWNLYGYHYSDNDWSTARDLKIMGIGNSPLTVTELWNIAVQTYPGDLYLIKDGDGDLIRIQVNGERPWTGRKF